MLATETDKYYGTGFLAGAFDLFHIGHLNIIRRSKERCDHLMVGVLDDECIFLGKGKLPVIPLAERLAIVAALRDVDEVVVLTVDHAAKLEILEEHPYDVFFSGDDYADDPAWIREEAEMKKRGADLLFFPYTKTRSSTGLQQQILPPPAEDAGPRKLLDEEGQKIPVTWLFPFDRVEKGSRVVLYGTGKVAVQYSRQVTTLGYCQIVAFADKNFSATPVFEGCPVWNPKELPKRQQQFDKIVIASAIYGREMTANLRNLKIGPDKIV